MIKPARLEKGMTIGVIAPSGSIRSMENLDLGIKNLESHGYKIKEGKYLRTKLGYLAGTDRERLADLHWAFRDKSVDAIICGRGGYGTGRIVESMDFDLLCKNPKIFQGFSDITCLHLAIQKKCNMITFHGPMVYGLFGVDKPDEFGVASLLRALTSEKPLGSIWQGHPEKKRDYKVIRPGKARGRITGGNISLLVSSIGTPLEFQAKGRIVLMEEVDEHPYRIDRMLTQLILAGKLQNAAGIVIGRNTAHKDDEAAEKSGAPRLTARKIPASPKKVSGDYEQTMAEVFADRLYPLGIPVVLGLPFGHIDPNATIPMGAMASMDSGKGELVIEEAGVR